MYCIVLLYCVILYYIIFYYILLYYIIYIANNNEMALSKKKVYAPSESLWAQLWGLGFQCSSWKECLGNWPRKHQMGKREHDLCSWWVFHILFLIYWRFLFTNPLLLLHSTRLVMSCGTRFHAPVAPARNCSPSFFCHSDNLNVFVTKGSVSYLSSPCFSTSLGGIGGPARAIHGILAVMYWISIIRGGAPPPENGHGFNSHGWRGHGPPH